MAITAWEAAMRAVEEVRAGAAEMDPSKTDLLRLEQEVRAALDVVGCEVMREVLQRANMDDLEVLVNGVLHGRVGDRNIDVHTSFGPAPVRQTLYGRGKGHPVVAPMEKRLGLVETYYTPKCAKVLSHLTAVTVRSEAQGILKELGGIGTSEATSHRLPLTIMARYEQERVVIERHVRRQSEIPVSATKMQVGIDGVMVPMEGEECRPRGRESKRDPDPPRHERRYGIVTPQGPSVEDGTMGVAWHEASVATLTFYDDDGVHLQTTYLARMPEAHMETLAGILKEEVLDAVAQRPDLTPVMASDGAPGNWGILENIAGALPEPTRKHAWWLLDIFHAGEHLQDACDAIDSAGTPAAQVRRRGLVETLKAYDDGETRVIRRLQDYARKALSERKRDRIDAVVGYLSNNRERMKYKAAQDAKLPIATGPTEAAAKTLVGTRIKRSGVRLSQHGGQTILTLRAHLKSGRFEQMFDALLDTYTADVRAAA